jgi:hypothetical protein
VKRQIEQHGLHDASRSFAEEPVLRIFRLGIELHDDGLDLIGQAAPQPRIGGSRDHALKRVDPVLRQTVQRPRAEDSDILPEPLAPMIGGHGGQLALRIGYNDRALVVQQVRRDDTDTLARAGRRIEKQVRLAAEEKRHAIEKPQIQPLGIGQACGPALGKIGELGLAEDARGLHRILAVDTAQEAAICTEDGSGDAQTAHGL